jgi:Protein of unknown function (DUF2721)
MTLEMIVRTMQFILAPAVMINACAVLLSGLLAHYAAINARLREMNRERLERVQHPGRDTVSSVADTVVDTVNLERLSELAAQVPELLSRHRLVRDALLLVYAGAVFCVISMLVIALAIVLESLVVSVLALVVFLLGTAFALTGLLVVSLEIRRSHHAIDFEVSRISSIGRPQTATQAASIRGGQV